ncbi:hypothetical protein R5R35_003140 [Gryllus longicercus]|uniref:Uncharacterized protein n=1 Tax=Gryllus longicercus TaxID=2509291 RepID=A0AAN9Z8K3_9ORTH
MHSPPPPQQQPPPMQTQLVQMVHLGPAALAPQAAQAHLMAALPPHCQAQAAVTQVLAPVRRHDDCHQQQQQQQQPHQHPAAQQQQQQQQHLRLAGGRPEELGVAGERAGGGGVVCEPSPVLGCLLPPMPSPHDALFRQHHAELLRGAGLYADARPPPPPAQPPPPPPMAAQPQPPPRAPAPPADMRQEVA